MLNDFMQSSKHDIEFILDHPNGYRVLLYNGNFDIICDHTGIQDMINSMQWSGASDYLWVWNYLYVMSVVLSVTFEFHFLVVWSNRVFLSERFYWRTDIDCTVYKVSRTKGDKSNFVGFIWRALSRIYIHDR